jgi:beta-glucanase (GH16 family)
MKGTSILAGIAAAISVFPLAAQSGASVGASAPSGRELVWQDEFNGAAIDPSNWTFDLGASGWGNGEAESYTARPENARIEGGALVIEARQEKYQGSYFTSARLKTQGLRSFTYGRVEARIKVPAGKGLWPAFWLLGADIGQAGWPACGEIDTMEYVGKEPRLVYGTLHGPGYSGSLGISRQYRASFDIADDYHVYAVEWEPTEVRWYIDGEQYSAVTKADVGGKEWPFDKPFFIILNLAVGGGFPGPVALDTRFPARMLVDYVRVYAKAPD